MIPVIPARRLGHLVTPALVVILVAGLALASRETEIAVWQAIGQLVAPRSQAATIPLPDGDVLVLGGIDNDDVEVVRTTAELVDPFTGKVRVLPQRVIGRTNQTATLAVDKVIVAGGTERVQGRWSPLASVEVFDSKRASWTTAAPMRSPRSDHAATALRDGRLLVAGGTDGPRQLDSVEIYDPARDAWTAAAPMPEPRSQFTITTLPDGRVFVAGGLRRGEPTGSSLFYDAARDVWSDGPRMGAARVLHTAVTLGGGDVLMVGGQREASGTAERFDFRLERFFTAGVLAQPRMLSSAVRVGSGRVLVVGGLLVDPSREGFTPLGTAELWDPATNEWSDAPDPATARALGSFVLTQAGALWIGGAGDGEHALRSIERFSWR